MKVPMQFRPLAWSIHRNLNLGGLKPSNIACVLCADNCKHLRGKAKQGCLEKCRVKNVCL